MHMWLCAYMMCARRFCRSACSLAHEVHMADRVTGAQWYHCAGALCRSQMTSGIHVMMHHLLKVMTETCSKQVSSALCSWIGRVWVKAHACLLS